MYLSFLVGLWTVDVELERRRFDVAWVWCDSLYGTKLRVKIG